VRGLGLVRIWSASGLCICMGTVSSDSESDSESDQKRKEKILKEKRKEVMRAFVYPGL
jgi:hypothetical protein